MFVVVKIKKEGSSIFSLIIIKHTLTHLKYFDFFPNSVKSHLHNHDELVPMCACYTLRQCYIRQYI